jgi:hypothetical protein
MKLGRIDFRWSYPDHPEALLLEIDSRKSQHMWQVCDGLKVGGYNLRRREIYLRPRFMFHLTRFLLKGSRISAMLCARLRAQNIGVVVASENHDVVVESKGLLASCRGKSGEQTRLFAEVTSLIPSLRFISVQHGQELRRFPAGRATSNVTLLCWGDWAVRNFPLFGRNERKFLSVGSLIDGLYQSVRPTTIEKDVEISFISTVKGTQWWGSEIGERRQGYEILAEHLARYTSENSLPIHVALTIDRDQFGPSDAELERSWFVNRFGPSVRFTNPSVMSGVPGVALSGRTEPSYVRERYATYYLCDRSNLTIGMTSSVLWESFGRGNKVLAVNFTDNPIYDFPISGIWSMRQPSYEQFAARMRQLLAMPQHDWLELTREARFDLIAYRDDAPPHVLINQHLRKVLDELR